MKASRLCSYVFCLFILWGVLSGAHRGICEILASCDYAKSRFGGINSSEFVTMGIGKNMTTNQVATLLGKASSRTGLLKMQYGGLEEDGYSQFFTFEYGPKWPPFFIGRPRRVCNEMVRVSFDDERLANGVERVSVSGLLIFAKPKQVHLE